MGANARAVGSIFRGGGGNQVAIAIGDGNRRGGKV